MPPIIFPVIGVLSTGSDLCSGYKLTTLSFFTHLVDVLGPEEFLAPVCMLIIGKAANRVARQQGDDLHATLTLSLSIIHHYSSGVQMTASPPFFAFAFTTDQTFYSH